MSARKQKVILGWSMLLLTLCGIAFGYFMRMMPPPDANQTADQVASWYQQHHTNIRIGAAIAGWTSAFMIQFAVVIWAQIKRQEEGVQVWAALALTSGALTAVFFAFPPIAWGAAAFAPERAADVTAVMHQLGTLTYITTDQLYLGMWVAVAVICLTPTDVKHSPFPRWWGYLTIWTIIMFEAGAIAFIPHTGPFAWNGLLAFWFPLFLYGGWMLIQAILIWRALTAQQQEAEGTAAVQTRVPEGAEAALPA
jgi:hypothetical protein